MNSALIIFVHGLGGSRYGDESTWGNFPRFIFEDFPDLDVGLYEFRTLLRRVRFWESVTLSQEAEVFAGILRDASQYNRILLVGHSMGGLLCMEAIRYFLKSNQQDELHRFAGLFLMATPQAGSQRVPKFLARLSKDFRALEPHGDFVKEIQSAFTNYVLVDSNASAAGKVKIPAFAVLGSNDNWVDGLSAGLGIPDSQKKTVRGKHTEIVKPPTKEHDAYRYLRACVESRLRHGGVVSERPFLAVLDVDGQPYRVEHVSDLSLFGVRKARTDIDTHGDEFFPYIVRDVDAKLDALIDKIVDGIDKRMLLLIGSSTVGKSRTAAEAVRRHPRLRGYQFLVPHADQLTELPDRLLDKPAILWLDDFERYLPHGVDRGRIRTLVTRPHILAVATLRTEQLRQVAPSFGLRSPGWDLINDPSLVAQIELSADWSEQEKERLGGIESDPVRARAFTDSVGLGEYLSAAQELSLRLKSADPLQRALVNLVTDWARIGLDQPITEAVALGLLPDYLDGRQAKMLADMPDDASKAVFNDAQTWASQTILGASALVTRSRNGLRPHDYLVDLRAHDETASVPHNMWLAGLEMVRRQPQPSQYSPAFNFGGLALVFGQYDIARQAWTGLAETGNAQAMNALGVLESGMKDLVSASRWFMQAAAAGEPQAMYTLGRKLYALDDLDGAQDWWERAAQVGNASAMNGLAAVFQDKGDLTSSREWLERAANAGDGLAMANLAKLLRETDERQSQLWLERAAATEDVPDAMFFLGAQLRDTDRRASHDWLERAAAAGHTDSMHAMGLSLYEDGDVGAARVWLEKAAENGSNGARKLLGELLLNTSPDDALKWWEQAAETGDEDALNNIRTHFLHRIEVAAAVGDTKAMINLGFLLRDKDPEAAQSWFERAAGTGDISAMRVLAQLVAEKEPDASRRWLEQAAAAGDSEAMNSLGALLFRSDSDAARHWFERAAAAGHVGAMNNLGGLLLDSDPAAARRWLEKAVAAGSPIAEENLEKLLYSDAPRTTMTKTAGLRRGTLGASRLSPDSSPEMSFLRGQIFGWQLRRIIMGTWDAVD